MIANVVLPVLIVVSAVSNENGRSDRVIDCDIAQTRHNAVHIQIIPEMELFQVICYLSGQYRGITPLDFEYKSDIEERFGEYRNHAAVTATKELIRHHYAENLIKAYILNESILRAYTAYELAKHGRAEAAQMAVQSEQMNGYIYNDAILKLLQHYDANRDRYKRFDDFLPYLLAEPGKRIN